MTNVRPLNHVTSKLDALLAINAAATIEKWASRRVKVPEVQPPWVSS